MLVAVQCSSYKQARVLDAAFHHSIWRPAAHDGAPIPLRSAIHTCEPARQRAHALAQTPAFAISQRARRKVEALFAELKNYIGLRRLRLRRMRFVREQFYLAATAQNLKRLVRFLSCKPTPQIATA